MIEWMNDWSIPNLQIFPSEADAGDGVVGMNATGSVRAAPDGTRGPWMYSLAHEGGPNELGFA